MVWLAFDDTDSVQGGCTTYAALQFVAGMEGIDLIGPPRLVRLNPNVPHKTRGNGAVALRLGHGSGAPRVVGDWAGRPLVAYPRGEPLDSASAQRAFESAQRLIQETARLEDPRTNPGLVMGVRPPPEALYSEAVHRYVGMREASNALDAPGVRWSAWKNGRGVLGAAAAAAWPAREGTYEWILYREPRRWGTSRSLDPGVGIEIDRRYPTTFDNHDPAHRHLRIAPASPCPVLAGIRGTDSEELRRAGRRVGPEPAAGSLLFATNQATDDHLRPLALSALRPYTSAVVEGTVESVPVSTSGGHVFARLRDRSGVADMAAFEPTKEFRKPLRELRPGDRVRAYGGINEDPSLVCLEKFELVDATPRRRARAPDCAACGRRMKSRGRAAGYRCPGCRLRRSAPEWVDAPAPSRGAHEVPTLVRRHLARPLRVRALASFAPPVPPSL